jgi:hypothetical protein
LPKMKFGNAPRDLHLAGELGFEPRLTESESAVLPLNYSPTIRLIYQELASSVFQIMRPGFPNLRPRGPIYADTFVRCLVLIASQSLGAALVPQLPPWSRNRMYRSTI